MNRRRFLALLGSTAVAPALPAIAAAAPVIVGPQIIMGPDASHAVDAMRYAFSHDLWAREMRRALMESRWIADLEAFHGTYAAPKSDTIKFRRPRMFTEEAA